MKTCARCGQTKGNRNFGTFGGGQLAAICKQCSDEAINRLERQDDQTTPSDAPRYTPPTTDKAD